MRARRATPLDERAGFFDQGLERTNRHPPALALPFALC
jgi:hypothetical protein